jgi:exopolysaccharide biosynthesis polyprenyl glycosylphosphotransferase
MQNYKPVKAPLPATSGWQSQPEFRLPTLTLHFSERRLLLIVVDLFLLNSFLLLSLSLRSDNIFGLNPVWTWLLWFLSISAIWLVSGLLFSIYELRRAACAFPSLKASLSALVLTFIIYVAVPYITPALPTRRIEAIIFPVLSLVGIGAWRLAYAKVFVQPEFQQRALVVGSGKAARALALLINDLQDGSNPGQRDSSYKLLGFVDEVDDRELTEIEGFPVLGSCDHLLNLVHRFRPSELIIALNDYEVLDNRVFQALLVCREQGIALTTMSIVYERLTGRTPVEHAGHDLSVALPLNQSATHRLYLIFRRLLDIVIGLAGCLLLLPVIPPVWVLNRLFSPGPLFYRQERVGEGGKLFSILKFRSMVVNAEKTTGAIWAREKDPRITPLGHFLRKTRVDEIPQFWNILKGDMSLIGPRPERPYFVNQLVQKYPFYRARHATKPGLTGWAQVKYRYGSSENDALVKLQYDLYYIKHQGLLLDLVILFKTVGVVLGFKGR